MRLDELGVTGGSPSAHATTLRHRAGNYALAALAGACNTLCFAPTAHGGWFEPLLFALLYALLMRSTHVRSAALLGGAFGFGNFVTGVYWLFISMHTYGGMPAPLAATAVVLFTLYLALYPALAGALWRALTPARATAPWAGAALFASAWAVGEWLRGWVFTGFPWLSSGYAQVDGPFGGFAPLAGVYGVGWILVFASALLGGLAGGSRRIGMGGRARNPLGPIVPVAAVALLLAAGLALPRHAWTTPAGAALTVRLLQGNVPQSMKFEQAGVDASLALYRRLITEHPADLVVTPETALPVIVQRLPQEMALALRTFSDTTGSAILFGAVGADALPTGTTAVTNSLYGIAPGVPAVYRYDKNHLVPFGEFVPWGFHWFVALMSIPLGDFTRGAPVQAPFVVRGQALLPDICYEDLFGEEIARALRAYAGQPGILVNSTNLAWFGNTIAVDQHLQIARMRALETGRPVLRATNAGATAAIDADGRVTGQLTPFTVGVLTARVQGTRGATPYVRYGNVPAIALALLVIGLAVVRRTWSPGR